MSPLTPLSGEAAGDYKLYLGIDLEKLFKTPLAAHARYYQVQHGQMNQLLLLAVYSQRTLPIRGCKHGLDKAFQAPVPQLQDGLFIVHE
jgi:hypothetical protein